jgi:cell division protein FtsL
MEEGRMTTAVVRLLTTRVRGFRVLDAAAFVCLVGLMLAVYLVKAGAGQDSARINQLNRDIVTEQREVRRLQAELSRLEQPARIERLADQMLGLKPVSVHQEVQVADLRAVAVRPRAVVNSGITSGPTAPHGPAAPLAHTGVH